MNFNVMNKVMWYKSVPIAVDNDAGKRSKADNEIVNIKSAIFNNQWTTISGR
jgi:hypothetical protein